MSAGMMFPYLIQECFHSIDFLIKSKIDLVFFYTHFFYKRHWGISTSGVL